MFLCPGSKLFGARHCKVVISSNASPLLWMRYRVRQTISAISYRVNRLRLFFRLEILWATSTADRARSFTLAANTFSGGPFEFFLLDLRHFFPSLSLGCGVRSLASSSFTRSREAVSSALSWSRAVGVNHVRLAEHLRSHVDLSSHAVLPVCRFASKNWGPLNPGPGHYSRVCGINP